MSVRFTRPKTTIIVDLDDTIWNLVDHWIKEYNHLACQDDVYKSQVSSWDIEKCLGIEYPNAFWGLLDTDDFWNKITVDKGAKDALEYLNSREDVDLIICTDTYFKSAFPKLRRFFELFPFIEPRQLICCKEKWRLDCDVVVDDKPQTLDEFMNTVDSPLVCKIAQPWNKNTLVHKTFDKFDMEAVNWILEFADNAKDYQRRKEEARRAYARYNNY
jgi:5'(3')-deoxyribonucleotidase